VDSADSDWTGLSDRGSTVVVVDAEGAPLTFAKRSGGGYSPTGDDADSGLTLTAGTAGTFGPTSFTVADLDGNATTFTPKGTFTASPTPAAAHPYQVSQVTQPGSAQTTTYSYDTSSRVTQILAPVPAESTCTSTTPGSGTWTGGCKGLYLTYGTSGNTNGRLTAVTFRTTSPAGAELDVDVVCYAYDANARLSAVWDPRDGTAGTGSHPVACGSQIRPTTYTYDSAGRIATITPPGLAAWTLGYDSSGRLSTVSRTHNSANGGGTETHQVVYGVATTADSTHPQYRPDLSATAISAWGQAEAPVTATAVFAPGHAASSTDLREASVSYLNAEGRTVNTADYSAPGGVDSTAGWHIDTTDYDARGNVVRTLTASNRDEALDPTNLADPALNLPTDTVAAASALSTVNLYAYDPATGTCDLTDTFGPYHLVTLPNGTRAGARAHTRTSYDTGNETGHPAGGLLHLPVTVTVGASLSANPVATNETDVRTTSNEYALSATDTTGWTFRQPMKVTTDPGSGHLAITAVTRYDATTGAVIETRQPKSDGADAGTTQTIYYTAGTNSADPACGNKPAWATLTCLTRPAAQPGVSGLPGLVTKRTTGYDYLTRPVSVVETVTDAAGTTQTRTTSTSYTSSGYGTDTAATTITGGLGAAVPPTTITYDPATGLPVKTSATATATQAATSQTTGYDDFGRVTSFTDNDQATGNHVNTTTTTYDAAGRIATTSDAHGSRTYAY
jgi:YD repeat-containing protein